MTHNKKSRKMNKTIYRRLKLLQGHHYEVPRNVSFEDASLSKLEAHGLGISLPNGLDFVDCRLSWVEFTCPSLVLYVGGSTLHFSVDEVWKLELWLLRRLQRACYFGYGQARASLSAVYSLLRAYGYVGDIRVVS